MDNIDMILARIFFALLSAFSYPLQVLPCRMSVENLLPLSRLVKRKRATLLYILLTSIILSGTFIIAFLHDDLVLISGTIGTLAGIPICYILPFVFYFKLTEGSGWTPKRVAAVGLAIFGVIAMIISGTSLIIPKIYPGAG